MAKGKREANFELLRIIAMAMVITLHYLGKGGLLTDMGETWNGASYGAWLLEAFCVVAVDVYVLISGWFLVESTFSIGKLFRLWLQIFCYSLGVPVVLYGLGILSRKDIYLDRLVTWCLPILREHYWFATAYVILYLLAPVLGKAVKNLSKKEFQQLLAMMLVIFCISKSIFPGDLPLDRGGYDAMWFLCLFLVAAYLRRYGGETKRSFPYGIGYLAGSLAMFGLMCLYRQIYWHTGALEGFVGSPYQYNHVLCLGTAVLLFLAFRELHIPEGHLADGIIKVASCTFGIYLLHENDGLRYLWQNWLFANRWKGSGLFIVGVLLAIVVWFGIGILVELCRQKIFGLIFRK